MRQASVCTHCTAPPEDHHLKHLERVLVVVMLQGLVQVLLQALQRRHQAIQEIALLGQILPAQGVQLAELLQSTPQALMICWHIVCSSQIILLGTFCWAT